MRRRKMVTVSCVKCGQDFDRRDDHTKRSQTGEYCSFQCYWSAMRRECQIKDGYRLIYMPGHHRANKQGNTREHIVVAEQTIGRPIGRYEAVHHINGDRGDNRPENLQVFASNAEHIRTAHPKQKPVPTAFSSAFARTSWRRFAKSIRERDGESCSKCGQWGNCVQYKGNMREHPDGPYDAELASVLCRHCHGVYMRSKNPGRGRKIR
jgi:hypothetical protein